MNLAAWQPALEEALARSLPAYLPRQRWFGAKARRIASAAGRDLVWLTGGDEPCALIVVRVEYASGAPERYALLVALRRSPDAAASLGPVSAAGETRHAMEASGDSREVIALMHHLGRAHDVPGARGGKLRFGDVAAPERGGVAAADLAEDHVRPLGAEQSNTSVRVGAGHVFKLFRRLEPGENPEVEVGRFLTAHPGFAAIPALRGSVTWVPADGPPGTVGVLQDLVANEGDGWSWALARLRAVFAREESAEPLVEWMRSLGGTTAEMHAAMASGAGRAGFAPEPVGPDDVAAWRSAFEARAVEVMRLLAYSLDTIVPPARAACERLLQRRDDLARAAELPAPGGEGAFAKIRVHGDYHLGQTLKTPRGFVLIDFEGEPSRPLVERRRLHCALKDVAGMLRSFDYALETARGDGVGATTRSTEAPDLRAGFLAGYLTRARALGGHFLPADPAALERWLTFFELDKALYELEYELQNRPAWVHIPARGLLRMLGDAGA
jgi:maltose alpha-D-glucosyltransferase/alpha-amylase